MDEIEKRAVSDPEKNADKVSRPIIMTIVGICCSNSKIAYLPRLCL